MVCFSGKGGQHGVDCDPASILRKVLVVAMFMKFMSSCGLKPEMDVMRATWPAGIAYSLGKPFRPE